MDSVTNGPLFATTPPLAAAAAPETHTPELKLAIERLQQERRACRVPLFILGSGISANKVPFLWQFAKWLKNALGAADDWILASADALIENKATRRQAAEFFSALQEDSRFETIWHKFSEGVLSTGLEIDNNTSFPGLCEVTPTPAHYMLANLLHRNEAYVISLNFDGLTHKASISNGRAAAAVHSLAEIDAYFASTSNPSSPKTYMPAVIKVRGDVFYVRCSAAACYVSHYPQPIDRLNVRAESAELVCPNCNHAGLKLQFQFPGYREKEEAAHPMLTACRRFLDSRISSIIILSLSGRWDRYMLKFIFEWAVERNLIILDVNPGKSLLINDFREQYYASVRDDQLGVKRGGSCYLRLVEKPDIFLTLVEQSI